MVYEVEQDPFTLNGFPLGVNNIQPDTALDPSALRNSSNIDLYDDGKVRRRKGHTLIAALVGAHSLWSDTRNMRPSEAFYAAGTTMYRLTENAGIFTSTAIVTGLAAGRKIAFDALNGETFWSNGVATGRIRSGVNTPWGIETPNRLPSLTASAGGGLFAGRYQVALTYRNAAGEEGACDNAQAVDVATNGKIVLTSMPTPLDASVTSICVYATAANGDVLHRIATIPSNASTHTISTVSNAGAVLKTQYDNMPAGNILEHLNGVMYVASGSIVYHSLPMRYGLCDLTQNFYMFPADVSVMLAVADGLFVCADKTYFLSAPGTPEVRQAEILSFGAVSGTGTRMLNSQDVVWFSPRGQVIGSAGGQVKLVTEAAYMPGVMSSGASLVREKQGLKQIINTIQQTDTSALEFTGG